MESACVLHRRYERDRTGRVHILPLGLRLRESRLRSSRHCLACQLQVRPRVPPPSRSKEESGVVCQNSSKREFGIKHLLLPPQRQVAYDIHHARMHLPTH
ncbi:unnamed protein product [Rodentolepis nana]|uniref:Uncharacterized protein n=1 Tax=Rodentolepis nana TaxID=102285 RepID=A0A0R3TP36_RODNA|nr:unnamed protein product [Rodentolepis nana]